MATPTVVGLLCAMHEALSLDRDDSHTLVTAWIGELSGPEARAALDGMAITLHALAADHDVDLEDWLRRVGLSVANADAR